MYASSLLLAALLAAGAALVPFVNADFERLAGQKRIVGYVAAALLIGLCLDLALTLLTGRIAAFFVAVPAILLASAVLHATAARSAWFRPPRFSTIRLTRSSVACAVVLLVCLILLDNRIAFSPLREWDARSIWLFHGKVLFFDGGIAEASWARTVASAFHGDYPKLMATLAAQVGWLNGYWNEYAPISALLIFVILEIALIACLIDDIVEFLLGFVLVVFLATAKPGGTLLGTLTNGYMDAHLALLAVLALGLLIRGARLGSLFDICLGLLVLGVVANLKNEGLPLVLVVGFWPLVYCCRSLWRTVFASVRRAAVFIGVAVLAALPIVLWRWHVAALGMSGDLFRSGFLDRVASRLDPETLLQILLGLRIWPLAGIFGLASLAYGMALKRRCPEAEIFVLAAASYCLCLVLIYLGTPHDLAWHIGSSADRTGLAVNLLLVGGIVTLYRGWRIARRGRQAPVAAGAAQRPDGHSTTAGAGGC